LPEALSILNPTNLNASPSAVAAQLAGRIAIGAYAAAILRDGNLSLFDCEGIAISERRAAYAK
jgi:hypothetical protein